MNKKQINKNILDNQKENISHSKYVLGNFEELIKSPRYTFKEPEYNNEGEINMYWKLEKIKHDVTDRKEELQVKK